MSPRAGVTGGTPTTTSTASGSPTTTVVGSNSATTTIAAELPPTGSNGTNTMVWIGALLLGAGAAISLLVRRQAA
jgi:LPXTG-motif cell wall-anchored protein